MVVEASLEELPGALADVGPDVEGVYEDAPMQAFGRMLMLGSDASVEPITNMGPGKVGFIL